RKGNDSVARFPIQSECNGGDAFGSVLDYGDLIAMAVHQPCCGNADSLVRVQPLWIIERSVKAGVVSQRLHCLRCRSGERRNCGVIQIDERLGHWELTAKAEPEWPLVHTGLGV